MKAILKSKQVISVDLGGDIYSVLKDRVSDKKNLDKITENSKHVHVQKVTYEVEGFSVEGFIVAPLTADLNTPIILYCRGGIATYSAINVGFLFHELADYARAGFVVYATQYRGLAEGVPDRIAKDDILDVVALLDVARELKIGNPNEVHLLGESRGGLVVYGILSQYRFPKSACVVAGISCLEKFYEERPKAKEYHQNNFYLSDSEIREKSAFAWAKEFDRDVRLLMIHGDADKAVPLSHALDLSEKLKDLNYPHEVLVIKNADHIFKNHSDVLKSSVVSFFREK